MRASHKRQLKAWSSFWVKVGALFAVTMAGLAAAANVHRAAAQAREQNGVALRAAIETGTIQAWPVGATRVPAEGASSGASNATITAPGGGSVTVNYVTPGGSGTAPLPPGVPKTGTGTPLAVGVQRGLDGSLTLSAPSYLGKSYVLEVSFDLRTWVPVLTNIAADYRIAYGVSNSPALAKVYYRISGAPDAMLFDSPPIFIAPPIISPVRGKSLPQRAALVATNTARSFGVER